MQPPLWMATILPLRQRDMVGVSKYRNGITRLNLIIMKNEIVFLLFNYQTHKRFQHISMDRSIHALELIACAITKFWWLSVIF